jgi:hypothetical protein
MTQKDILKSTDLKKGGFLPKLQIQNKNTPSENEITYLQIRTSNRNVIDATLFGKRPWPV